ncbi:cytochrome P450 [Salimicrobium salexigens]|uniref:Fatty-acid peroxygenase n=1 Tax=Salimicrobium salexigens TaxID=908941 RepID=A0ABY1KTV7_9BACI|nr:cytochrome P450 [Salimicrobium salexigens]SIS77084.1 fatty-acid peroxygenase [Salimicrobium salexigens]
MSYFPAKDKGPDRSLGILKDGYNFARKRLQKQHLDVYETKLLGERAALLGGEKGAELFYDNDKMKRGGAMPAFILKTLFGENGIQTMDGNPFEHRKRLFLSLMTPEALDRLFQITAEYWERASEFWEKKRKVVLYNEMLTLLMKISCEWAGVPLKDKEVKKRADDFALMIDGFGSIGPKHLQSRKARQRSEQWFENLILDVREGKLEAQEGTAIFEMAMHRDLNGNHLDARMAAIELLNIVRPTVAVSKFITFGALAMEEFPEEKEKVAASEDYLYYFAQEVRRFYPFVPYLPARTKKEFAWQGYNFSEGQLVLIDVYGNNHDPRIWEEPETFNPERFRNWNGGLFDLIPQGGGDYEKNHRCPGEWSTLEILKASFQYMARHLDYKLPKQDLSYSLNKMPALPKDGFIMKSIKKK